MFYLTNWLWGYESNFEFVILQRIVVIYILSVSSEIALRWIPQVCTDDKWTLVQAFA